MFKQIMYNLLSNAIKFTPEGGSVHVAAKVISDSATLRGNSGRPPMIEVSVADTGIGIRPEDCERIFGEFVQLDHSYGRKQEGTGLGLALTRKLVELHGGNVIVHSQIGKGSIFTFTLPLAPIRSQVLAPAMAEEEVVVPAPTRPADRMRPLVLVVEDDRSAADLLHHYLTEDGYDVVQAFTAEQAIDMARSLKPDVITLDVILPNHDGWQFLAAMKASGLKEIPVVVVSITDDRTLGYSLGAAEWLVKPVQKEHLLDALSRILSRSGGAPERVLVIDDEPADLEYVADILEQQGVGVLRAHGGHEGIDLAIRHVPDVIVLDLMMPEVNGFEVVHRLRQHEATVRIPIVIFTAQDLNKGDWLRIRGQVQAVTRKSAKEDLLIELEKVLRKPALAETRSI
jgi:DNA-binding response OmpR family regulator